MEKHADKVIAKIVIALISVYLVAPIIATIMYSFAKSWVNTILPDGWTLEWYLQLVTNSDFLSALIRSIILGIVTTIIAMCCFLPVVFYANVYDESIKARLRFITVLPFTIPGIVLVTGLVRVYANLPIPQMLVLLLAISLLSLPVTYQALDNAFIAHDFRAMFEQALILGDSPLKAFVKVVIPNIRVGMFIAMLLTFTSAFGEYVLTNIILGGNYETLKIYMYRLMQSNGQASSVLTTVYFFFLAVISIIMIAIMKRQGNKKVEEVGDTKKL
ncbi:ABC transporter permease [Liquorilactobacillus mali]|uniref:ABC transporter permease n=1 Tax=Liquorilactobacillus mali KCTC 3596 = DSM 20444 TaxID=1046596 RepID=J0L6H9_9LACO|nr:ABC transporter permease subunit [Liquorilactobacillus mali]EJF00523.1 ABC transporter permease [Liquorilactobacillus mali KCTC 3596 = DSM 20444]KRN09724.1 ABC transporter permease [Liquorilactobacillus mali KCTC 3596 = DSM 20444]QFQ74014.1 ABC transporter permease subunit [Liquorilactobacillus mali]